MRTADPCLPVHGGDAARIAAAYGLGERDVLDFSVNVNPLGPPPAVMSVLSDRGALASALSSYPDRHARVLKSAVYERYGVSEDSIIVGNGSAALIDAILRVLPPSRCSVPVPAFSEYRRAIDAAGHAWHPFPLRDCDDFQLDASRVIGELREARPDVLILTNPHNPSGALCERDDLLAIVSVAAGQRCKVILDEAFIDYVPERSLISEIVDFDNLIILRSVTKFYGMPALRVGYAVTSPRFARRVEAFLPSWPVTSIALDAAAAALGDPNYDANTIALNARLREDLDQGLRDLDVRIIPSAANFLLIELPPSWGGRELVCDRLVRFWGIVVRNCRDYEGLEQGAFVRVAVREHADNERLLRACRAISDEETP